MVNIKHMMDSYETDIIRLTAEATKYHIEFMRVCEENSQLVAEVEEAHLRADASDSDYLDTKSLLEKAEATNQRLRNALKVIATRKKTGGACALIARKVIEGEGDNG